MFGDDLGNFVLMSLYLDECTLNYFRL